MKTTEEPMKLTVIRGRIGLMTIRPSGGRLAVTVRREDTTGTGARAYIARHLGPWKWNVPAPKGHPRTPSWETLHGRAHSMDEAVEAGLSRLAEVYGAAS